MLPTAPVAFLQSENMSMVEAHYAEISLLGGRVKELVVLQSNMQVSAGADSMHVV